MTLTLRSLRDVVHIDITLDQFKRLRDPKITDKELADIAKACNCDVTLLQNYSDDLKHSLNEAIELDGSCDYSDHL